MLVENMNGIESVGFKQTQFKISNSSKMFDILSNFVYSNKIESIVRELSSNAFDAHVMNNKKHVPFDITLPSNEDLHPCFIIRDYGPGLSTEDIYMLYTTYGESTKTNSNDFIGAWGLGSKSPFSYTNSFNVTSWFEGKKSIYLMAFNEERIPCVTLISSEDSKEPSGLEISIPVSSKDIKEFVECTEHVLAHFDPLPNVYLDFKVAKFCNFNKVAKRIIDLEYGYLVDNSIPSKKYFNCLIGNIPYCIDINQFTNSKEHKAIFHYLDNFFISPNSNLYRYVLKFDIGEIDVTASRENIQWTKKSFDAFKRKLVLFHYDIVTKFFEMMDNKELENIEFGYLIRSFSNPIYLYELISGKFGENTIYNYFKKQGVFEILNDNGRSHFIDVNAWIERHFYDYQSINEEFLSKLYYTKESNSIYGKKKYYYMNLYTSGVVGNQIIFHHIIGGQNNQLIKKRVSKIKKMNVVYFSNTKTSKVPTGEMVILDTNEESIDKFKKLCPDTKVEVLETSKTNSSSSFIKYVKGYNAKALNPHEKLRPCSFTIGSYNRKAKTFKWSIDTKNTVFMFFSKDTLGDLSRAMYTLDENDKATFLNIYLPTRVFEEFKNSKYKLVCIAIEDLNDITKDAKALEVLKSRSFETIFFKELVTMDPKLIKPFYFMRKHSNLYDLIFMLVKNYKGLKAIEELEDIFESYVKFDDAMFDKECDLKHYRKGANSYCTSSNGFIFIKEYMKSFAKKFVDYENILETYVSSNEEIKKLDERVKNFFDKYYMLLIVDPDAINENCDSHSCQNELLTKYLSS